MSGGKIRYVVPIICGALAAAAFYVHFSGRLAQAADDPLGPITLGQAALLAGLALSSLCALTALLAVMPDPSPALDPRHPVTGIEADHAPLAMPADLLHLARRCDGPPTTEILDALAECVTRTAVERDREQQRVHQLTTANACLETENAALAARLCGILDNSSAEGRRIRHEALDGAQRSFRQRLSDIETASLRVMDSLRAGKASAEAAADEATARVQRLEAHVEQVQLKATVLENRRIRIALETLASSLVDDLRDPADRALVSGCAAKLVGAVDPPVPDHR